MFPHRLTIKERDGQIEIIDLPADPVDRALTLERLEACYRVCHELQNVDLLGPGELFRALIAARASLEKDVRKLTDPEMDALETTLKLLTELGVSE